MLAGTRLAQSSLELREGAGGVLRALDIRLGLDEALDPSLAPGLALQGGRGSARLLCYLLADDLAQGTYLAEPVFPSPARTQSQCPPMASQRIQ